MNARRALGAVVAVAALAAPLAVVAPATADDGGRSGRFDKPWEGWMPASTELGRETPEQAGLDPTQYDALMAELRGFLEPAPGRTRPLFAGATVLVAHDGDVVLREALGKAVRYADGSGTELPADQQVDARTDTVWDMASVSKLFTAVVVMQQVEQGRLDLDAPVASYLPGFAANGKGTVTTRHLLTHTAGLPAWLPLWSRWPDRESRLQAVLDATPTHPPGAVYRYSDLSMITAGMLAEKVSGQPLDVLVRKGVTQPLGMVDTGYNPSGATCDRVAATEFQSTPARGMVRCSVHDENAWSLGGVAGHAGVFSTADDIGRLGQAMLSGGAYDGRRILTRESVDALLTDLNGAFPGNAHGLGFELDQRWYMDGLSGPRTAGHTGYTGTSLVIDPQSRTVAVLLSNRVHPSRSWGSNNPARRAVAHRVARSLAVEPQRGPTAWSAGHGDSRTATLSLPVALPAGSRLGFDLFVDTQSTDPVRLEASRDGGVTWEPVAFTARSRGDVLDAETGSVAGTHGRHWWQADADLSGLTGAVTLRWTATTDALYQGRGVYVDGIRVASDAGQVVDTEKDPSVLVSTGWSQVSR